MQGGGSGLVHSKIRFPQAIGLNIGDVICAVLLGLPAFGSCPDQASIPLIVISATPFLLTSLFSFFFY